jgi:hypothetical protein
MFSTGFLLLTLLRGQTQPAQSETVRQMVQQVAESGRCVMLAESPDTRVTPPPTLPPGPPPLLSFRYYELKAHHRVGNSELMLDDAGH